MVRLKMIISLVCVFLLPSRVLRFISPMFGWNLGVGARIGFSFLLVDKLIMGEGASIGSLNIIKTLNFLSMGVNSTLGNLNWITGIAGGDCRSFFDQIRVSELILGEEAAITHRHYIDCTNTVAIGAYSTLAGVRSQIFTHSISLSEGRQKTSKVFIGRYCFVGSGVIILPGSGLMDYSVLGAGALLNSFEIKSNVFLGGNPAKIYKNINIEDYKYFNRFRGVVD